MIIEQHTLQNLQIISAFKNRTTSVDALKNYSGWGGLRDEVYVPSMYQAAFLVQFIYDWLSIYGFKEGVILIIF